VKAVVLREVGGDLALEDCDEPGGSVVAVRAAGVNFADVLIRRGLYPQMPELPYVLGNEVAGELDGKRVAAFTRGGGGYAERAAADPQWVFELPEHASFAAGASFLTTYLTAYIPLVSVAHREKVLVHAGSGGVGSAAIQLARHFGSTVYATASTDEKREVVRGLGATPLGYEELDDLRVDCVLDPVGVEVFTR
jgi:NADPH2:quinone reductase